VTTTTTEWEDHPQWLRALLLLGLGEALVLTSYALGCNDVDAAVGYLLILVARARIMARKLSDFKLGREVNCEIDAWIVSRP
jgi:phosphate/sulfate permease